ncbi:hypothetical protein C8R46DRAFT_94521 [Mycena filopes]|nr:hypothetical protein C8R46DRAFT_94521 [Mycena filopes]
MDSSDKISLVPPALTLPPEIVSEIFLNFLPSYPDLPPPLGLFSPLLLCQICRLWRAIAVSAPDLWRAIPLDLTNISSNQDCAADQVQLAETWLARSGTLPLSIRLVCASQVGIGPKLTIRLVDILLPHRERWEYLELVAPIDALSLVGGSMPLLRAVTIGPNVYPGALPTVLTPFHGAPQLRSVVLTESYLTTAVSLPWAQLTRLGSRCLYPAECVWILLAAPQLVHCQFMVFDERSQAPTPPVVHTRLRHLILDADTDDENRDLRGLLDKLTLPALKTLQVLESWNTMEALKAFISRSNCVLEELVITEPSLSRGTYCETFPSIPSIVLT